MAKNIQVQYDIQYHIIWLTKYKYNILTDEIAYRVRELISIYCEKYGVEIAKGIVGKDYIHILISCPPNIKVSKIIKKLKKKSSKIILKEFKELKKEYHKNLKKGIWIKGYFCQSYGNVTEEIIKDYIKNTDADYNEIFKIVD